MINHRFKLENSFQEMLYLIYVFINERSGWNVESIVSQYINTSTYRPLSGSSYISLSVELQSPRKGLINIKSKDKKCFLWCHVRPIKPSKEHPGRIRKIDKKLVKHITNPEESQMKLKSLLVILIMMELSFLCKKKISKMSWFFQFMFQIKNLKTLWICCF